MDVHNGLYTFTRGIIDMVWLFMLWGLPFVILRVIIGLIRRAHRAARGESFEDMTTEYHTLRERFRTHTSEIRRSPRRP